MVVICGLNPKGLSLFETPPGYRGEISPLWGPKGGGGELVHLAAAWPGLAEGNRVASPKMVGFLLVSL